ncbi:uncharacterized protein H6S33_010050 [Morchella sextelata]|uniref:uncharacterized protein n=1 Tax=Morchella sextelata TaxID=1174677 RepID=UPI001D04212D|nr:uncharacterized protein H6S33_010050 [Morchella sextelata]KAH0611998.1 hypothetical protein H6S33_010050 [Morchella sextelata]
MPLDRRFTWLGASRRLVYGLASHESPRPLDYYYFGARLGLRTQSLPAFPPRDPNRNNEDIGTTDPGMGEFASERSAAVVQESRLRVEQRSVRPAGDNDEEDMEREIKEYERLLFGLLEFLSGPQTLSYSGPGGVIRYYTEVASSVRKNHIDKKTSRGYQSIDADCPICYERDSMERDQQSPDRSVQVHDV